jgi:hypothetical protein
VASRAPNGIARARACTATNGGAVAYPCESGSRPKSTSCCSMRDVVWFHRVHASSSRIRRETTCGRQHALPRTESSEYPSSFFVTLEVPTSTEHRALLHFGTRTNAARSAADVGMRLECEGSAQRWEVGCEVVTVLPVFWHNVGAGRGGAGRRRRGEEGSGREWEGWMRPFGSTRGAHAHTRGPSGLSMKARDGPTCSMCERVYARSTVSNGACA